MSKHPTSVIDLCAREIQIALAVSPCEGESLHTPRRSGFSYPTTSTMAFFRGAYPMAYLPIKAAQRIGKSHIKPFKDVIRSC